MLAQELVQRTIDMQTSQTENAQGGGVANMNSDFLRDAVIYFLGKLLMCAVAFAAGGSGGILMPVIICGGVMGYIVRCLCLALFGYDAAAAAIPLGIAAFFSALTRLPLTSTILSCEITGAFQLVSNPNLIFPILVASIVGARASSFFAEHTVFERMMTQDGINPHTLEQQIRARNFILPPFYLLAHHEGG